MSRKMPFLVLLIAAMSPAVHAQECYDWLSKDALLPGDSDQYSPVSLAFDEKVNKMALLTINWPDNQALWYYDGDRWEKAWEGIPQSNFPWILPVIIYYDHDLEALVCISYVSMPASGSGFDAFRYDSTEGFVDLVRIGPLCPIIDTNLMASAYDPVRKRAVLLGISFCVAKRQVDTDIFLEFDGQNFYEIPLPPGLGLFEGVAGYNPDTRKVVFFGLAGYNDVQASTWEYDGSTWIQIKTDTQPSFAPYSHGLTGLAYVPQYHGLLTVDYTESSFKTWLYDSTWHELEPEHSPENAYWPVLAANPENNKILFYDIDDSLPDYNATWEFRTYHCRPVSRP